MKRSLSGGESSSAVSGDTENEASKKIKQGGEELLKETEAVLLDENLLFEILQRIDDGSTLAKAACVSRLWKRTAQDERLWELICTKHHHRSPIQLRAVVSALGGFRSLYSSHLWPLLKPVSSSPAPIAVSAWPYHPPPLAPARSKPRWGKDEVNLSLSLLSIKYFEKMSFNNRSKSGN
ncbi:F-box protein GID2 [Andrographis paniculata]|uniref:F-box protein GID2 n=1 Tax=Andrographis paniculata TaxID=175694 RepID=UPI0021E76EB3|nr:F-box protein GID2 [Andrographis paniculata]